MQDAGCVRESKPRRAAAAAAAWSLLVVVAFGAALQRGSGGDGAVSLSCQASAAETQRCGKCRSAAFVLGCGGCLLLKASSVHVYERSTGRWHANPAPAACTRQVAPLSGGRGVLICLLPQNGCCGR